jgi:acetyltransferase
VARTLAEDESGALLAGYGVPVVTAVRATDPDAAAAAADRLGYPVVAKLVGPAIAHKTERGLVRLRLGDAPAVRAAAAELLGAARPDDGEVGVLVAPMVSGTRELVAGLVRDPQFGPCVMVGVGGVLTEALGDVAFVPVPLDRTDALEAIEALTHQALLGPVRGEPAIDRHAVADVLLGLAALARDRTDVRSVDVNPCIVVDGRPLAVDALVEIGSPDGIGRPDEMRGVAPTRPAPDLRPLFDPGGVVVVGASSHPGKFGFVALHNLLASGYRGEVHATNRDGGTILGVATVASVDDLPADAVVDLAFVCTPAAVNPEVLAACARRGIRAAFVASAGYAEAGEDGRAAQDALVALGAELGIVVAGPNGQGVVSTPASLCAQIVAPAPPPGPIAIASQSGNFVSSFMNLAVATGVGVSRAVSAGNAAAVGVVDYLEWFADDPHSTVALAYVEGLGDGRAFADRLRAVTARMPVVVLKGGATASGQQAAASHTGALASDDRVFAGVCRQAGAIRAGSVEEAFEAAATLATQPRPRGNRVVVCTTAGGWGVVTADAIQRSDLDLVALPDDLRTAIAAKLPPRWSRGNPIDFAGAETRDTIPEVLDLVAAHPDVDAVILLGLGIQSNQARLMRGGGFYPDHGLERIVAYHERQDARFARAAAEVSARTGKPVLVATELAVADPDNAGPRTVRETGRLCYPSADRAVRALEHLWHDARHRMRRAAPG